MTLNTKRAAAVAGILILFSISFGFFYNLFHGNAKEKQRALPPEVLNRRLPENHLVDLSGEELPRATLERGKVILVLVTEECSLCLDEAKFLGTLVNTRPDVRFYGVVPFGADKDVLKSAESKFPFKVLFDDGFRLGRGLKIKEVPVKIYLEDGVIKKTWIGSTPYYHTESEFAGWLGSLE